MSILKRFSENFGIKRTVEGEQKRFVERINQIVFHRIDTEEYGFFNYPEIFEHLCFELGINAHDVPRRYSAPGRISGVAVIRTLTKDDFVQTLLVLCVLYDLLADSKGTQEWLSESIEKAFSCATCDLDIRWKEGFFYPSGAKELDKSLIEEPLTWIRDYPDERKDYQKALEYYLTKKNLGDVIINCYLSVEGLGRKLLNNRKTLENNREALLQRIGLSQEWKSFLSNYIKYANEFKRHASDQRHTLNPPEVEAFLYFTGLILRLLIESR